VSEVNWNGGSLGRPAARGMNQVNGGKRAPRRFNATCKFCLLGIYDGDPRVWLSKPMGLSHEGCATTQREAS
jgi:hypothetical protein